MTDEATRLREWTVYATAAAAGVELLHARFVRHVYERHVHEAYCLGVTEWGVQAFRCRGASHASSAGMVMAFNPDEPHDGHAADPGGFAYRMLYVDPGAVRRVLEDAYERPVGLPFARAPLLDDARLAGLVARTHRAFAAADALAAEGWLAETVADLAARHAAGAGGLPRPGANPAGLRRARDHLHASLEQPVTADGLAAVAGMSRFHLARQFRAAYGLPPHAYLLHLRLMEARRRLAAGVPPAEVAAGLAFADQSHLHKRFKGAYGITPGQYARASGRRGA